MGSLCRKFIELWLFVWVLVTVVFLCLYVLPGDPARIILGPQASQTALADFREAAGLDSSLLRRYGTFFSRTVRLDFGYSWMQRRLVSQLLWERGGVTARLAAVAALLTLTVGLIVPIALRSANAASVAKSLRVVMALLATMPPYLLGVVVLLVAGRRGWGSAGFDGRLGSWLAPAVVLAIYPTALVMRLLDIGLERELTSVHVRRARSMGMTTSYVLLREALPGALSPALAAATNNVAYFVTGAFFVETVFGVPGLGRLAAEAIRAKDVAVLGPLCLVFAAAVVMLAILLDRVQSALSPRTRSTT